MKRIQEIDIELLDAKKTGASKAPKLNIKDINKMEATTFDINLLEQARTYYNDMDDFRERRMRNRKYVRGDQWSDEITDPDDNSSTITEEQYIINQGKVPLKQNFMRSLCNNLSGQYQASPKKSMVLANKRNDAKLGEMLTNTLYYAHQINHGQYLDARNFDEFMLSGLPVCKIGYKFIDELERPDIFIENINPRRICINTDVSDPLLRDLRLVCEIQDSTIEDVINAFAKTKKQAEQIRDLFLDPDTHKMYQVQGLLPDTDDALDFLTPMETNKCRIFEIWYKKTVFGIEIHDPVDGSYQFSTEITAEEIDKENELRTQKALENGILEPSLIEYNYHHGSVWFYKFLTNQGYCLLEGESPYEHGEHPYVFLAHPMIDGEIWGRLEDVIDQQRYVNRLVTQFDFFNSAQAKGVWLIPQSAIPEGWNEEDYKAEIVKIGGAVVFKDDKTNPNLNRPFQQTNQALPAGMVDMISMQLKWFQEISGVHPAIQGMSPQSGTPASLYAQEALNAATNVIDMMNSFGHFIKLRDRKILKTIIQFYNEKKYLHIAGTDYEKEALEYDPDLVDGMDFDLIISEGNNSPVYRSMMDDMLLKLLEMQAINIEMFLQNTSFPFADKLLESIRQNRQDIQNGLPPQGIPPELLQQIQQQGDPRVQQLMNQNLSRVA